MYIQKYDLLNNKNQWISKLFLKGNLFDIIKMDTTFLVFTNFIEYTNMQNNLIKSHALNVGNETNILSTTISSNGEIKKMKPYFNKKSTFGLKAYKINSEIINIVGINSKPIDIHNIKYSEIKTLYYLLINKNKLE